MDHTTPGTKWKIAMLPRLQVDAIVACFLLKYFGEKKFPGIQEAKYVFWINVPQDQNIEELIKDGYIFIDMGGGTFDHHGTLGGSQEKCTSQLVAEYLGVENNRSLRKLLEYARRDDLEGKGIVSKDPIDRAFGLSGLINDLNRMLPDDQETVLHTVMPLFIAHYMEEKKRAEDLPIEYAEKIKTGKASLATTQSVAGQLRIVIIETDEIGMAGYLRAQLGIDIVIQKMSSGHINILTQQKKAFDLSRIIAMIRKAELKEKGASGTVSENELTTPGRMAGVEEWYFDTKARTLQNGGIRPQGTTPTRLSLETIAMIVKEASAVTL